MELLPRFQMRKLPKNVSYMTQLKRQDIAKNIKDELTLSYNHVGNAQKALCGTKVKNAEPEKIMALVKHLAFEFMIRQNQSIKKEQLEKYPDVLKTSIPGFTLKEMYIAFDLAQKGQLDAEIPNYPNLSPALIKEVMAKYRDWKARNNIRKELKVKKEEPSDKQKERWIQRGINNAFRVYRDTGKLPTGVYSGRYDYLVEKNRIDKNAYKECIEEAKQRRTAQIQREQEQSSTKEAAKLSKELKNLDKSKKIPTLAKEIAIERYFNEIIANSNK